MEKMQLKNYLDAYKCMGVSLEIADGLIRPLDVRIDIRIKPGYIAGQIKSEIASVVDAFFNLDNTEMGIGFKSTDLIKQVSAVSGIATSDFYFGGLETLNLSDGTSVTLGNKVYQQIKDIPSYSEAASLFPTMGNPISGLAEVTQSLAPYEIITLGSFTINVASR